VRLRHNTALIDVAAGGVEIMIICDWQKGDASRVIEGWPSQVKRPRIFLDQDRKGGAPYASMHAKCLLVDGKDLYYFSQLYLFVGFAETLRWVSDLPEW
jgi:hypothetical protein